MIAYTNVVVTGRYPFQFVIQDETHMINVVPSSVSTPQNLSDIITILTLGSSPRVLAATMISLASWTGSFCGSLRSFVPISRKIT